MGPSLISWNLTRQCNLRCPHCYLDATATANEGELSSEAALAVVDEIADLSPGAMLVLSGGEPLLRKDLAALVGRAAGRGLVVVIGTNGTLLDGMGLEDLRARGLSGAGISLDSPGPGYHDSFRGVPGAWSRAVRAMEECRRQMLPFQVQATLTRENLANIRDIVIMSHQLGASAFNLFFLVCTGRGESLTDISAEDYEQALATLSRLQSDFPLIKLRARCAPHFTRLLAEGGTPEAELPVGCMAGAGYLRLTPEGEVTPCPYLPIVVGDLRRDGLSQVWNESPVLAELRAARWRGRCGACRLSARCRGCRARAYAATGDYLGEDPWCTHQPQVSDLARPLPAIPWQPEAQRRMERAPGFIRERVMAYIEALAREQGCAEVTVALLDEARQKLPRTGMRFHR